MTSIGQEVWLDAERWWQSEEWDLTAEDPMPIHDESSQASTILFDHDEQESEDDDFSQWENPQPAPVATSSSSKAKKTAAEKSKAVERDSEGRLLQANWRVNCTARQGHVLAQANLKDLVVAASQTPERIELQAGQVPVDQLWAVAAPLYNDYKVSPARWQRAPQNEFPGVDELKYVDPSDVDQMRTAHELKKHWVQTRRRINLIYEQYTRSGQNEDASWRNPMRWYHFSGKPKGNGKYGKPDNGIMYMFLLCLKYPHIKDFALDTLPDGVRFNGSISFGTDGSFSNIVEPPSPLPLASTVNDVPALHPPVENCDRGSEEGQGGEGGEEVPVATPVNPAQEEQVFAVPAVRQTPQTPQPSAGSEQKTQAAAAAGAAKGASAKASAKSGKGKKAAVSSTAAAASAASGGSSTDSGAFPADKFLDSGSTSSSGKRKMESADDYFKLKGKQSRVLEYESLQRLYQRLLTQLHNPRLDEADVEHIRREKQRVQRLITGVGDCMDAEDGLASSSTTTTTSGPAPAPVPATVGSGVGGTPTTPSSSLASVSSAGALAKDTTSPAPPPQADTPVASQESLAPTEPYESPPKTPAPPAQDSSPSDPPNQ